VSATKVRGAAH